MPATQLGDFLSLTTNDGQVLTMPNQDISVLSWGGFGAPPVSWITKQGYRQHGETEVGYILQKRPITMQLHYNKAESRSQYWQNRATLHEFLRHNRLGPLTLTVTRGGADDSQSLVVQNTNALVSNLGASTTSFTALNVGTDFWGRSPPFFIGQLLQVQNEQMLVLGFNSVTNVLLVQRGYNGTAATSHLSPPSYRIFGSLYPVVGNSPTNQRSIIVRADPGLVLAKDPQREAGWYIDEDINFVAFNPIWFDPVTNVLPLPVAAQQNLIFPITFPITFGTNGILMTGTVTYPGSWYAYPQITLTGPYTYCTIQNVTTGVSIVMSVPLIDGATRIITTTPGQLAVNDANGVDFFSELGPTSDLVDFNIRPNPEAPYGINVFNIIMPGFGAHSSASLSYQANYFGI